VIRSTSSRAGTTPSSAAHFAERCRVLGTDDDQLRRQMRSECNSDAPL